MKDYGIEEIYVAVTSLKAKIRCVHTDDLYIAYFLRKNDPALRKAALYALVAFPHSTSSTATCILSSTFQNVCSTPCWQCYGNS